MSSGFQAALDHIRSTAESMRHQGALFERLMKRYFEEDPLYADQRFKDVWLWSEWASSRPEFDAADTGIDLVAEERDGSGWCAIQCKCYAPGIRVRKAHLDSFISASSRAEFASRIVVDTGDDWGPHARKTVESVTPACTVLRFGDLAERPIDWPDLVRQEPEELVVRRDHFSLRPHQRRALNDVVAGFRTSDRGQMIMACGTGKTFASLRIAEELAGVGGRVLYLVPSISLLQQSMREWATHRSLPHRYIGICSDTKAGRTDEDASLAELEIPVSTDLDAIRDQLRALRPDALTVTFCTYQSIGLIEQAQLPLDGDSAAPEFDLVLCDEAHRTTGVEGPGDDKSPFVLVHDGGRIRAARRLYMTATPRLYTEGAKRKAANHAVEVFSMDDPAIYGPEFHRLPFSRAVEQDLLSDYKVVVLAVAEEALDGVLQEHLDAVSGEVNLGDAAKIVGCWRALQNPENQAVEDGRAVRPLRRAIAFTNTIKSSRSLDRHWTDLVARAARALPEGEATLRCETRHVDGKHNALARKARIEWLKGGGEEGDECRILSNARCLSEGIDVPALDAVLFMSPRNSHVDIVQAVGRAMRKAPGKTYGYIVLPVAVPSGVDPATVLDDNERFAAVWGVLRALRSHDDRFDAEINRIDLNRKPSERIIIIDGTGGGEERSVASLLPFQPVQLPPGAIYAKIVEKCGDRKYWEQWASDVADIYGRLVLRIEGLLAARSSDTLRRWVDLFVEELQVSMHDQISRSDAVEMLAQHLLTRPVFEALFADYDFAGSNPVSRALQQLTGDFEEYGLQNETRDLEPFYRSVRMRARGLDNSDARQRVLNELYEKFFAIALKKHSERLGIVYTPVEVVDFILHSADWVLRREFGKSLGSEGVHVLDPFTGTGLFLVRLLQSGRLVPDSDLLRKYRHELHANELMLLAYYIAAVHIEEALHGRLVEASEQAGASAWPHEAGTVREERERERERERLRAVRRHRAHGHVQPAHRQDRRFPARLAAREQRTCRASAERAHRGHPGQSAVVGRPAQFRRRQPEPELSRPGAPNRRYLRRSLDGNAQARSLRHVQEGHPLGLRPHRRPGRGGLRHQRLMGLRQRGCRASCLPG